MRTTEEATMNMIQLKYVPVEVEVGGSVPDVIGTKERARVKNVSV